MLNYHSNLNLSVILVLEIPDGASGVCAFLIGQSGQLSRRNRRRTFMCAWHKRTGLTQELRLPGLRDFGPQVFKLGWVAFELPP